MADAEKKAAEAVAKANKQLEEVKNKAKKSKKDTTKKLAEVKEAADH